MVNVTLNAPAAPQPAAVPSNVVVDSKGRRLTIREPNLLDESRLIRALGDYANNTNYVMLYCMPAAMVAKIDDIDMIFPTLQSHVDAAITAIGREGMAAVMDYITTTAKQKAQDEEAVKKSAGTPDSEKPAG